MKDSKGKLMRLHMAQERFVSGKLMRRKEERRKVLVKFHSWMCIKFS